MKASELTFSQTQGETSGTETPLQGWPQGTKKTQISYTQKNHTPTHTWRQPPRAVQAAVPQGFFPISREMPPLCMEARSRGVWASSRASESTASTGQRSICATTPGCPAPRARLHARAEAPRRLCTAWLLPSTEVVSGWAGEMLSPQTRRMQRAEGPFETPLWSVLTALLPRPRFLAPWFSLPTAYSLFYLNWFSPHWCSNHKQKNRLNSLYVFVFFLLGLFIKVRLKCSLTALSQLCVCWNQEHKSQMMGCSHQRVKRVSQAK